MIRTVIQSEASECGLAALAMLSSAHGLDIGLPELRRQFPFSLKGAKLTDLMKISSQLGFKSRALRLEMEGLKNLSLPCILHWDLNHFVVLVHVGNKNLTIIDPACGKRKFRLDEASKHFTGIALELLPSVDFKPIETNSSVSIRQLTGRVRGLWGSLSQILVLSLALQVFVIVTPFYMQWIVDQVVASADKSLLTVLGIGFGISLILQIAIGVFRGISVIYISSRLGQQWLGNVFSHAIRLPIDFFEKRHLGDITSRMSSVQSIQRTLTTSFIEAIIDGLMAAITIGLMFLYSWKLASITLLAIAIYSATRALIYQNMRNCNEQQLISSANQQTYLLETLRGMQSVKLAGIEYLRQGVYENFVMRTINSEARLSRMILGFQNFRALIFGLERIIVIWAGALLAMQNVFSVGMLVAYLAYKDQFTERMASLIDKLVEFRMLRLHGNRLSDIILTSPEDIAVEPDSILGGNPDILVSNISYRYGMGEPWVIKNLSLHIIEGESVAIIGPSGCGKTTLVKLLLGLIRPTEGSIHIAGLDLHKAGPQNLRKIIGAVMQDDHLFAGTIGENISLFADDYDQEQVESAAKLAAIHEDVALMPMGYNSLIGDMGSALSGGQKQRIILARALYRKPRILILDEATSHLDIVRERLVNTSVQNLALTKVIIAHRPETIASADRVIAIENGRVHCVAPPESHTQPLY